jgi:1-deoxy-D-xylulose-5-phosphate reductoisomerase
MGRVKTRVVVLGSTGSIGTQALEIVAENPDLFELVGISAHGSKPDVLLDQVHRFGLSPSCVAVASDRTADLIDREIDGHVIRGAHSSRELAERVEADVVLNAFVGSLGLDATLATLEGGARLALANKESLVAGGDLVLDAADEGQLIPVDSEHSAILQCLRAGVHDEVASLVLTASGGPFRGWTREQLEPVTPLQAAEHPTWSMGQMNTLNSSTMVNKGLEVIEASLLFDTPADRIEVTVHPESVVHSMVTFTDGATIAQASPTVDAAADQSRAGVAAPRRRRPHPARFRRGDRPDVVDVRAAGRRGLPRRDARPAGCHRRRPDAGGVQRRERGGRRRVPRRDPVLPADRGHHRRGPRRLLRIRHGAA